MNCSVFKDGTLWNNIGEVAVQSYKNTLSVYNYTLLRKVMRSFTGVSFL